MAERRTYSKQLVIRVDEDTHNDLKAAAERDGRTPTQMARKILNDWLATQR